MNAAHLLCTAVLATSLVSCVETAAPVDEDSENDDGDGKADIWGTDDRKELYAYRGTPLFEASRTEGGLIDTNTLEKKSNGNFAIPNVLSLRASAHLCKNQRFATQPASAYCSGTLIAPDLIVTAGHCLRSCSNVSFVFGLGYDSKPASGALNNIVNDIPADNVYTCKEIVARELTEKIGPSEKEAVDYAVIRLDRAVVGRTPAKFNISAKLAAGTAVAVIGHPSGLPLKIAEGKVLDATMEFMVPHDADVFGGNSGCGLFDIQGLLVGMHSRSSSQRYVEENGCYVVAVCGVNAQCPEVPKAYDTLDLWTRLPANVKAELAP